MKFFFATQTLCYNKKLFGKVKQVIELISVGIVCENGNHFYAVSKDFDMAKTTVACRENVIKFLPDRDVEPWKTDKQIIKDICRFLEYHSNYDDIIMIGQQEYIGFHVLENLFNKYEKETAYLLDEWPIHYTELEQIFVLLSHQLTPSLMKERGNYESIPESDIHDEKIQCLQTHFMYPALPSNQNAINLAVHTKKVFDYVVQDGLLITKKQNHENDNSPQLTEKQPEENS